MKLNKRRRKQTKYGAYINFYDALNEIYKKRKKVFIFINKAVEKKILISKQNNKRTI